MSLASSTPQPSLAWLSPVGVAAAWLLAIVTNWGLPVTDLDPVYLHSFEALLLGGEAVRPGRQLSWGLFHWVGHLGWSTSEWSRGHFGVELRLFATLIVPWLSWITYRLGRSLGLNSSLAWLAALLAAWGPGVQTLSGMADALPRALALGTGILAIAVWSEAQSRGGQAETSRASLRTIVLMGLALAWHPSAVIVPVLAIPVWLFGARGRRTAIFRVLGLVGVGLLGGLSAVAWTGQGEIAAMGFGRLFDGLWVESAVAAATLTWQLPILGGLALGMPWELASALAVGVVLLVWRWCRAPQLAVFGAASLLSLLPEAAALGFLPNPEVRASVGPIQAGTAVSVASALLAAGLVNRLSELIGPRRVLQVFAGVLLVLFVIARALTAQAERKEMIVASVEAQDLLVGGLLVPHAVSCPEKPLALRVSQDVLRNAAKRSKWLSGAPKDDLKEEFESIEFDSAESADAGIAADETKRESLADRFDRPVPEAVLASFGLVGAQASSNRRGKTPEDIDGGLWDSANFLCDLWLGRPFLRDGLCSPRVVGVGAGSTEDLCSIFVGDEAELTPSSDVPVPAAAGLSKDPRAGRLAVLGLLLLFLGLRLGSVGGRSAK